jgi:hypothetical protein
MRDGLLVLYCGVIGFVAAGIAASFYKMITSQPARFSLLGPGWLGALSSFFFFALTGPAILMEMALEQRKASANAGGWLLAGFAVSALWSLCSGIIVLGLVLALRSGLA